VVARLPGRAAQGRADKGSEAIALSAADRTEMMAKLASVGDDIVKAKPELKPL
jgi:hypothetical protein